MAVSSIGDCDKIDYKSPALKAKNVAIKRVANRDEPTWADQMVYDAESRRESAVLA